MAPGVRLDTFCREEYGRILTTLIRLVGDFDLAEEAVQEAFTIALSRVGTEAERRFLVRRLEEMTRQDGGDGNSERR